MNDRKALRDLRAGSQEALIWIMNKYGGYVSTIVWNIIGPSMSIYDAEEVVSDVFLALWNSSSAIRTNAIKSYLAGIVRKKAKMKLRESGHTLVLDCNIIELGITVQQWVYLLQDKEVFTASSLQIMKRMKDYGGAATCKQLSVKYGESVNFYNSGSSYLAKRIAEKTGCPVMLRDTENSRWWPILYVGKYADKATEGTYIWKLRDELSEALDQVDLADVDLYFTPAEPETSAAQGYWWLNANPSIWSFSNIAVGAEQSYTLYNDNGNKRRIFQNFLDAKAGDIVIGYESHSVKQAVAIARISRANDGQNLFFEKIESLSNPIDYLTLKACPELERMEYFVSPQGSLFKLTKGEFDFIMDTIREVNPLPTKVEALDTYTKEDFLNQVYMTEQRYETLVSLLRNKRNLILQGAPGVGKTFAAKRLAYSMMGVKDESRIKFVQFHQNYSYEDFVMGYNVFFGNMGYHSAFFAITEIPGEPHRALVTAGLRSGLWSLAF